MTVPINIALIGCGRWGANHARVLEEMPDCNFRGCVDPSEDRRQVMAQRYGVPCVETFNELREFNHVEAAVVAVPAHLHNSMVLNCLDAGLHVLCEKPLSISSKECIEMGHYAQAASKVLMVGHVFLFNDGIIALRDIVQSGDLGDILYVSIDRSNLGPVREDVGAAADLATHDISILQYVFDKPFNCGGALKRDLRGSGCEDVAVLAGNCGDAIVTIVASWADAVKTRRIKITGTHKTVVWNDLGQEGPIMIYDSGVRQDSENFGVFQHDLHHGGIEIPSIPMREPLKAQMAEFVRCIMEEEQPASDWRLAASIACVLESISGQRQPS